MVLTINLVNIMLYCTTSANVGMMFLNRKGEWRPSRITMYGWAKLRSVEIKEWV